jgi:hypothetical protein
VPHAEATRQEFNPYRDEQQSMVPLLYLKYIQAATATKTTARIQRDESLIPVFLAMANLNLIYPFPDKDEKC